MHMADDCAAGCLQDNGVDCIALLQESLQAEWLLTVMSLVWYSFRGCMAGRCVEYTNTVCLKKVAT